jgi:hypothetical protein
VQRVVRDVDKAVETFASFTKTAQNLPKLLSAERQAIIKQLTDWSDTQQDKLVKGLEREEPRLKGMLTEVREILLAGTELAKAVQQYAQNVSFDPERLDSFAHKAVGEFLFAGRKARPGLAFYKQFTAREPCFEQQAGRMADQPRHLPRLVEAATSRCSFSLFRKVTIGDWPPTKNTAS